MKKFFYVFGLMVMICMFSAVSLLAADRYVNATTGNNVPGGGTDLAPWKTIQYAINNSSINDIIHVAAGQYKENITINKSLTLLGAGANTVPVEGNRLTGESVIMTPYITPQNWSGPAIMADNVTINGFEIVDAYGSITVPIPSGVTRQNVNILYNYIHSNAAWTGISLFENSSNATLSGVLIDHNLITLTGNYTGKTSRAACINLSGGGASTYNNVGVSNNELNNPGYRWLFAGGSPAQYLINTMSITGNHERAGTVGFNLGNISNGVFSDNLSEGTGGTIGIDTGTISGNTFANGAYLKLWGTSYGFTRPAANLTISNNLFTDGSYLKLDTGVETDTIVFATNSFVMPLVPPDPANSTGILIYGNGVGVLDASHNWWGTPFGPDPTRLYSLDAITSPWITGYTDDPNKDVPPAILEWPLSTLGLTRTPGFWPINVVGSMPDFLIEEAKIDWKNKPTDDKAMFKGVFNLPDGADPEPYVTLMIGGAPAFGPIPMTKVDDKKWEYKRPKDIKTGIKDLKIDWKKKEAKFEIHIDDANLSAVGSNPAWITLQIGAFSGSELVTFKADKNNNKWEYHRK